MYIDGLNQITHQEFLLQLKGQLTGTASAEILDRIQRVIDVLDPKRLIEAVRAYEDNILRHMEGRPSWFDQGYTDGLKGDDDA